MMNVATPGVGSMRAGQIFTGVCQLGFGIAGAALICVWMMGLFWGIFQEQLDQSASQNSSGWMWKWGVVCFVVSWLWTLVTCVQLYRRAKAEEQKNLENLPPRLADLPKKNSENQ